MITEYWHQYDSNLPLPSEADVRRRFPIYEVLNSGALVLKEYSLYDIEAFLREIGYETRIIRSTNPRHLLKYLGPGNRSPLIFRQTLGPDSDYNGKMMPFRILIGISMKKRIMIVHDQYLGPAYQMSFTEWRRSYRKEIPENMNYIFLIARPKNYKELIKKMTPPAQIYPNRQPYDRVRKLILRWMEGSAERDVPTRTRISILESVITDPIFPDLPPVVLVSLFTHLSFDYNEIGEFEKALEFARAAVAVNETLDKTAWGGLYTGCPTTFPTVGTG
jgi:hypothetical protein